MIFYIDDKTKITIDKNGKFTGGAIKVENIQDLMSAERKLKEIKERLEK